MWCSACQQDVPAVARHTHGPLVCSRCQVEFEDANLLRPADGGISLDEFDREAEEVFASPRDLLADDDSRQRLRQIGRQLRTSYHVDQPLSSQPSLPLAPPALPTEIRLKSVSRRASLEQASSKTSWQISLLLLLGAAGFCAGTGLLAWSTAFRLAQVWQWGMAATITAEGCLILGLTWMAVQLWHNSRRVNRQLTGVDRQLNEIQQQTGGLAGSRLSSSQHYYNHFGQVASPHYLLANLRGQIDQLAARIATEN